ncbi:MAG: low molecular weight protein-tyrosine-phosphatase [Cellvibrionaceae bacterium]
MFVCLGNICRSPTAHGIFAAMVAEAGLQSKIAVDSCGTSGWHIGNTPDPRSIAMAQRRGFDLSTLQASQIKTEDFLDFDYILAMDNQNLSDLRQVAPGNSRARVELLLAFDDQSQVTEVPDPYYGGEEGFTLAVELIESASAKLLSHIRSTL